MAWQSNRSYSRFLFKPWTEDVNRALLRLSTLAILLLSAVPLMTGVANAGSPKSDPVVHSGEIRGVIDYCGSSGAGGFRVHIPGRSFVVYTPPTGEFVFNYVPVGTWNLRVERQGQVVEAINGVEVKSKRITDLGTVPICPDADGDSFAQDVDCNDGNPAINPNAPDVCGDGIDNDCSGEADEGCVTCTDSDGDGYFAQFSCAPEVDCNDQNAGINPDALEVCGDGIDNNCDGYVDDAGAVGETVFYSDGDGDGYGDINDAIAACNLPAGFVENPDDCNDTNGSIHPGAEEICDDGIDNDCSGQADEGCPQDCDDGGVCTVGLFDPTDQTCRYMPAPAGTACEPPVGATCDGAGTCLPNRLPIGAACSSNEACVSGHCFDGVCCQSACNENEACTLRSCATGICISEVQPNDCLIDSVCYPAGAPNPANASERCDPVVDQTTWTSTP
jgi:hypothetical protein